MQITHLLIFAIQTCTSSGCHGVGWPCFVKYHNIVNHRLSATFSHRCYHRPFGRLKLRGTYQPSSPTLNCSNATLQLPYVSALSASGQWELCSWPRGHYKASILDPAFKVGMDIHRLICRVTGGFDGSCHAGEAGVWRPSAVVERMGMPISSCSIQPPGTRSLGMLESSILGEMVRTYS